MTMRGRGLEMKSGTYPKGARVFRKGVERLQGGVSPEGGHSQGLQPHNKRDPRTPPRDYTSLDSIHAGPSVK